MFLILINLDRGVQQRSHSSAIRGQFHQLRRSKEHGAISFTNTTGANLTSVHI